MALIVSKGVTVNSIDAILKRESVYVLLELLVKNANTNVH